MKWRQQNQKLGSLGELGDLIPKKSRTSVLREYFGFETADMDQKRVLCKACRAKVAKSSSNTANLYQHLKNHHRHLHDECLTKKSGEKSSESDAQAHWSKLTTITASFASVTLYEKNSRRHQKITTAITHYIAKDMVSVNTVTKDGFQNLLRTLDRRYKIPSRTYFNQVAILQLYAECKEKVLTELKNVSITPQLLICGQLERPNRILVWLYIS